MRLTTPLLLCSAVTENTRASYPIDYIDNAKMPCVGSHPKNLILLCCDAFGVLPPVSRLTTEQAMYHFISGYTAKVSLLPLKTHALHGSLFLGWPLAQGRLDVLSGFEYHHHLSSWLRCMTLAKQPHAQAWICSKLK